MHTWLLDIGRMGMGLIFLVSIMLDLKTRPQLFDLMGQKRVPMPWLFFVGAILCKGLTSLALIFNYYVFIAALVLAIYIFIANIIFNNFWDVPKEQRDFTICLFLIHLAACFGLLAIAAPY